MAGRKCFISKYDANWSQIQKITTVDQPENNYNHNKAKKLELVNSFLYIFIY